MDDQREKLLFPTASPSCADPIFILAPRRLDYAINVHSLPVPPRTQLHHFCDHLLKFLEYFISSVFTVVLLLFAIYQITLACYNCGLERTNLIWIRVSFFLNFPFVLGVFVYSIKAMTTKKPPSFATIIFIAGLYTMPLLCYSCFAGFYGEIPEVIQIVKTLENATALDLLPCPPTHYWHVLGMKIANWCSLAIVIPPFCLFVCKPACSLDPENNEVKIYDGVIFRIVNRWRYCMGVICNRHIGETVIP